MSVLLKIIAPNANRYETLRDDECESMLNEMKKRDGGCVTLAAAKLTPFVQALYNGEKYPATLRLELVENLSTDVMDSSRILELCEEVENIETARTSQLKIK